MSTLRHDLHCAVKTMIGQPGYFLTALLTLALGIGFSTAIFSVVNTVLLRPLPYRDAGRLLWLRERRLPQFPEFSVAPGHYLAWRDQATAFDGIASWGTNFVTLETGTGDPERVRADRTTANLFPVLGVAPALGRGIAESDDRAGAPAIVVLSYGAWQRRFGGSPGVIGRQLTVNREPATIVGVMPAGFAFPSADTEMWVPMAFTAEERTLMGSHYLSAIGRVKAGVALQRARDDLDTVAARLATANPDSSKGWDVLAIPMQDYLVRGVKSSLLVLLGAVALVLVIGCVNVANLLLVRGAARQKELAIRAAVGASRVRLVRQLMVEQLVLALCSAVVGVLGAGWLLHGLLALLPDTLPRQQRYRARQPCARLRAGSCDGDAAAVRGDTGPARHSR